MKNARYMRVDAGVRYWEDAEINGESKEDGSNVPFKNGGSWQPVIDLIDGRVVGWPEDTTASFHFKVCDAGNYYLLDADTNMIAEKLNGYVPDGLCHGDNGYGDYIIFNVDKYGKIDKYRLNIDDDEWVCV